MTLTCVPLRLGYKAKLKSPEWKSAKKTKLVVSSSSTASIPKGMLSILSSSRKLMQTDWALTISFCKVLFVSSLRANDMSVVFLDLTRTTAR